MNASPACTALIKRFEGCKLDSYQDAGGVWTIGYGSTGNDVDENTSWTQEHAEERLASDVEKFSAGVMKMLTVSLAQCQYDALVSFAYNMGLRALANSTLLKLVNKEEFEAAADQFHLWIHCAGKILPGLVTRRQAEKMLFEGEA